MDMENLTSLFDDIDTKELTSVSYREPTTKQVKQWMTETHGWNFKAYTGDMTQAQIENMIRDLYDDSKIETMFHLTRMRSIESLELEKLPILQT